jgi:hypothetical protein
LIGSGLRNDFLTICGVGFESLPYVCFECLPYVCYGRL